MKWILARSIKAKIAVSGALMAAAPSAPAYLHLNSELTCQDFDLTLILPDAPIYQTQAIGACAVGSAVK